VTIHLPPLWDDLSFNCPLSDARAAELTGFLNDLDTSGAIVDVGCGWGELLIRTVAASRTAVGLGIDRHHAAIERGRANAAARGLTGRVELAVGDAATDSPETAAAVVCTGSSQVWGDHRAALTALRALVPSGGRVVYGDLVWALPPTEAALEALEAVPTDYGSTADLVDLAVALGFHPRSVGEASLQEWDAFESGYSWGFERWLLAHPDTDPRTEEVRRMAADHRRRWLHGYRGVLGFAYLTLIAR
jgi:cyclopropane fatty-acyl-phospholipid synthase-like methyltransferase